MLKKTSVESWFAAKSDFQPGFRQLCTWLPENAINSVIGSDKDMKLSWGSATWKILKITFTIIKLSFICQQFCFALVWFLIYQDNVFAFLLCNVCVWIRDKFFHTLNFNLWHTVDSNCQYEKKENNADGAFMCIVKMQNCLSFIKKL